MNNTFYLYDFKTYFFGTVLKTINKIFEVNNVFLMIKTKINYIIDFKMLISLIDLIFISFLTLKLI